MIAMGFSIFSIFIFAVGWFVAKTLLAKESKWIHLIVSLALTIGVWFLLVWSYQSEARYTEKLCNIYGRVDSDRKIPVEGFYSDSISESAILEGLERDRYKYIEKPYESESRDHYIKYSMADIGTDKCNLNNDTRLFIKINEIYKKRYKESKKCIVVELDDSKESRYEYRLNFKDGRVFPEVRENHLKKMQRMGIKKYSNFIWDNQQKEIIGSSVRFGHNKYFIRANCGFNSKAPLYKSVLIPAIE